MKYILLITATLFLFSCNHEQADENRLLQSRIDSLESKLSNSYKPELGEYMSRIQMNHSKLWFAGQNENWQLADFEIHEISEAIADIKKYETNRKESEAIGMLTPAMDSINIAIQQKNPILFKSSFNMLTNTCNSCHHAVNFGFNVVKIPETSPFTNQNFKNKD